MSLTSAQLSDESHDLSVISQVDEVHNGSGVWVIPVSDFKTSTSHSMFLTSKLFYIGSEDYCKFSLQVQYLKNNSTAADIKFKTLSINFSQKLPSESVLSGCISYMGEDKIFDQVEFTSEGNFQQLTFCHENNNLVYTKDLKKFVENGFLNLHWALKIKIGSVESKLDNICYFMKKRFQFKSSDQTFNLLKKGLYEDKIFKDVKFRIHGGIVEVHRAVLFHDAPGFRLIFITHPNGLDFFKFYNIDKEPLEQMLQFLYTEDIPPLDFTLASLLYVGSNLYQVYSLHSLCRSYLAVNLTPKNVFIALSLAERCQDTFFKEFCIDFIQKCNKQSLVKESVLITK